MYFSTRSPTLHGSVSGRSATRTPGAAQAGNTLLQVVVILFVLSIGIYFLSERLVRQKDVTLKSNTIMQVHMSLNSLMDYMYFAIQRRYCLTETLLPAANCKLGMGVNGSTLAAPGGGYPTSYLAARTQMGVPASGGDPGNARSIERIMLSSVQAANMQKMINRNCINLGLESPYVPNAPTATCQGTGNVSATFQYVNTIDIRFHANDITTAHPLFAVIDPLRRSMREDLKNQVGSSDFVVHAVIQRDTNMDPASPTPTRLPISGNEVYFKVAVILEDGSGHRLTISNGQIPLELDSYGTMYPREVGSFAAMIPGNFNLDGVSRGPGDLTISPNPNARNWPGIVFKSPVFVNHDVHLPYVGPGQGGHYGGGSVAYTPVTFGDRLILGNGNIYDGGQLYAPQTTGGTKDTLWSDNHLFGGFKMGVLVDNAEDAGLAQYAGNTLGVNSALMQQCLVYYASTSDASVNAKAQIYANPTDSAFQAGGSWGSSAASFSYVVGMVDPNRLSVTDPADLFNPQGTNTLLGNPANSGWGPWGLCPTPSDPSQPCPTVDKNGFVDPSLKNNAVAHLKITMAGAGGSVAANAQTFDVNVPIGASLTVTPFLGDKQPAAKQTPTYQAILAAVANENDPHGPAHQMQTQYEAAIAAPPTFTVNVKQFTPPGATGPQTSVLGLTVSFNGSNAAGGFFDPNVPAYDPTKPQALFGAPIVDIEGFDLKFAGNQETWDWTKYTNADTNEPPWKGPTPPELLTARLSYKNDGTAITAPAGYRLQDVNGNWKLITGGPYSNATVPYDKFDYADLAKQCDLNSGRASNQSFGAADWNINFSVSTTSLRHSWNFAAGNRSGQIGETTCQGYGQSTYYASCATPDFWSSPTNQDMGTPSAPLSMNCTTTPNGVSWSSPSTIGDFWPYSIVPECDVETTANLVAGFYFCDTIEIKGPRTKPLTFIGTFITKNWIIDPSALQQGVTFYSIYHPDATPLLRASLLLRVTNPPSTCSTPWPQCTDQLTGRPVWDQSSPTTPSKQDMSSCNSLYLRARANPFTWTAVDPDCGSYPPDAPISSNNVCKNHPVNYYVMEQGRGGGP